MRLLGIDFGTKHLGFALGDPVTGIAVPLKSVTLNGEDPVKLVWGFVQQEGFDYIVVGSPKRADGAKTPMSERVEAFAKQLQGVTGLPVDLIDESHTSKVAAQLAEEAKKDVHDDALAAMLIAQAFLNEYQGEPNGS